MAVVGPRPLDGCNVLLTLGGCGGVGHVLTLHATLGWGGACINVHVNLQMKDMLRCGCRQVHVFMGGVGWGGIITSMSLSFIL